MPRITRKEGTKIPPLSQPGRSRVGQSLVDRKKGEVNRGEVLGGTRAVLANKKTRRSNKLERQSSSGRQPKKLFQNG